MQERALAEKLISYDTSLPAGIHELAGFVSSWLEARDIEVRRMEVSGLPTLLAEIGPQGGPTIVLHGHLDVVPGTPDQFRPHIEGDRLFGRGAYDMKGALAAMMLSLSDLRDSTAVGVRLAVVPDEETEAEIERATDHLVDEGYHGDFAITGEPTDFHVGVQAKGVLAVRIEVTGIAAHGATPWDGENAIVKAMSIYRGIESLPFSRESSELFDRPSINLGMIEGGDAPNKVPDSCRIHVDIRYLPGQDPNSILDEIASLPDTRVLSTFCRPPAEVDPDDPFVRTLCRTVADYTSDETRSIGRDGASDAVSFLEAGVPAVEFGPVGANHHGPAEWVSISSLEAYRRAICAFVMAVPATIGASDEAA